MSSYAIFVDEKVWPNFIGFFVSFPARLISMHLIGKHNFMGLLMSRISKIIQYTDEPSTMETLQKELQSFGITSGTTLVVHSSLSSLGYVVGGAATVILAFEEILSADGTLAMPSHTADLTDPGEWSNPPVPKEWHELIRNQMPPFLPDLTPTRGMGAIPECFRSQQGVLRSNHPCSSWAAWGKNAGYIVEKHALNMAQGESSPLARLYDLDAQVLLLGVGYDSNTCFHLAEYRCKFSDSRKYKNGAPVINNGKVEWTEYEDVIGREGEFEVIGSSFEIETKLVKKGKIANANCRLFSLRNAVNYAVKWMNQQV